MAEFRPAMPSCTGTQVATYAQLATRVEAWQQRARRRRACRRAPSSRCAATTRRASVRCFSRWSSTGAWWPRCPRAKTSAATWTPRAPRRSSTSPSSDAWSYHVVVAGRAAARSWNVCGSGAAPGSWCSRRGRRGRARPRCSTSTRWSSRYRKPRPGLPDPGVLSQARPPRGHSHDAAHAGPRRHARRSARSGGRRPWPAPSSGTASSSCPRRRPSCAC